MYFLSVKQPALQIGVLFCKFHGKGTYVAKIKKTTKSRNDLSQLIKPTQANSIWYYIFVSHIQWDLMLLNTTEVGI